MIHGLILSFRPYLPSRALGYVTAACWLLAFASACAPAPEPPAPTPRSARSTLEAVVDSVTNSRPLDRTQWGVAVLDLATRELVFGLNPDRHFIPASNTKLVVSAVGLAELGEDYRYRTEVHAARGLAGDSVADALVVIGRGDPSLSARFHDAPLAPIDSLADSVRIAGIDRVRGDLVIDVSYFDDVHLNPTWSIGWLTQTYAAPVTAFGIEEGTFRIQVTPTTPYHPAEVRVVEAPGGVPIENRVITGEPSVETSIRARRKLLTDTLTVEGIIAAAGPPDTLHLAVTDPADFAGRVFAAALDRRGVRIDGDVRVVHRPFATMPLLLAADDGESPLATWTSPPLAEIVTAILQSSQNWIAEQLLKTLGAEFRSNGSWGTGIAIEDFYLSGIIGIDETAYFLRDGSGLSHQNLLTPRAILRLLEHARNAPWSDAFLAALARPGMENSTLSDRLLDLDGRLMAKTGTITHVNALSGFVTTASGRELAFSILTNASGVPSSNVREGMDRIVRAIANVP